MKISEELYLKKVISQIKSYGRDNYIAKDFYDNLDSLDILSLQDLTFNSDLKFFDEVNFILSVIISIVIHPHISNKGENIILRAEQVSSLQNDMFLRTIRDSRLWKHNSKKEMIPEQVHYYQNVDEIRIYENIFIVMLINLISSELTKYSDFYSNMILTNLDTLTTSKDNIQLAFNRIKTLNKRIKRIKGTYFYKEVSKGGKISLGSITPTNILLKDRLYNYCFKFYRKMISYEDKATLIYDFTSYYCILFLKVLKDNNYHLAPSKSKVVVYGNGELQIANKLTFLNKDFKITIGYDKDLKTLNININHRLFTKVEANHELLINPDSAWNYVEDEIKNSLDPNFTTIEVCSIWNKAYILNNKFHILKDNPKTEYQLITDYLKEKTKIIKGSRSIYSLYCPSCRAKSLTEGSNNKYVCSNCSSSFIFLDDNEDDSKMWFLRVYKE